MSFGDLLPDRVLRAILVARPANFFDWHAAVRGHVTQAVADMLHAPALPAVPLSQMAGRKRSWRWRVCSSTLSMQTPLTPKERMALINDSPCAAALVADVALAARRRMALTDAVFAL